MRLVSDPADLLDNPRRHLLNTSLIASTLSHLTPENTVLFVGSPSLNATGLPPAGPAPHQQGSTPLPWPELSLVEPYYGTRFAVVNVTAELRGSWAEDVVPDGALYLPGRNEFVPKDLALVDRGEGGGASVPVKIGSSKCSTSLCGLENNLTYFDATQTCFGALTSVNSRKDFSCVYTHTSDSHNNLKMCMCT